MNKISIAFLLSLFTCFVAQAQEAEISRQPKITPQMALAAEKSGQHEKAIQLWVALAMQGDSKAMIHLGNKYYKGDGVPVDYEKTMAWYLNAFKLNNGNAPGNIGVLYRDGLGVKQNRKIAYLLFLITHMKGLGTDSTQIRVNAHLRREVAELKLAEIKEALCYTGAYLMAYINAKGELGSPPKETLPSEKNIRFKDAGWWMEDEKKNMQFDCPAPWN